MTPEKDFYRLKSGDGGRWTSETINRQLPAVASTAGFSGELPQSTMAINTELSELQRRLHDAHESSARLRDRITELEGWVAEGKRNGTRCAEERDNAAELLAEIMRDEVNAQDEAEKWLRAYAPHLLFS